MNKLMKVCRKAYPNDMVEIKGIIHNKIGMFSLRLDCGITLYENMTIKELIKAVKKDI